MGRTIRIRLISREINPKLCLPQKRWRSNELLEGLLRKEGQYRSPVRREGQYHKLRQRAFIEHGSVMQKVLANLRENSSSEYLELREVSLQITEKRKLLEA